MSKGKKILVIFLALTVIGIIVYFILKKGKGNDPRPCTAEEQYNRDWLNQTPFLPVEDDIHVVGETTECQRNYMTEVCGKEDWKCRKMIKSGAYIPLDYQYNQSGWNGCKVSDREILNWVYEIYYLTGKEWAKKEPYALLKQAEYQACAAAGFVSF